MWFSLAIDCLCQIRMRLEQVWNLCYMIRLEQVWNLCYMIRCLTVASCSVVSRSNWLYITQSYASDQKWIIAFTEIAQVLKLVSWSIAVIKYHSILCSLICSFVLLPTQNWNILYLNLFVVVCGCSATFSFTNLQSFCNVVFRLSLWRQCSCLDLQPLLLMQTVHCAFKDCIWTQICFLIHLYFHVFVFAQNKVNAVARFIFYGLCGCLLFFSCLFYNESGMGIFS